MAVGRAFLGAPCTSLAAGAEPSRLRFRPPMACRGFRIPQPAAIAGLCSAVAVNRHLPSSSSPATHQNGVVVKPRCSRACHRASSLTEPPDLGHSRPWLGTAPPSSSSPSPRPARHRPRPTALRRCLAWQRRPLHRDAFYEPTTTAPAICVGGERRRFSASRFARGSWIAVRIRPGRKPAGVNLSPSTRRRSSCAAAAAAAVRAEVSFVDADEAKRLVAEEGYTVLDIRDRTQRERAYIKSSTHVPLFIENQDNDIGTIVKRQLHNNFAGLFFGLPFTKLNPDFAKTVKDKFTPDSKVLVVCQEGLRSAAAADALEREGFQNIACITSGLQTVKPGTFESVGKSELQNAGKAGLVTIQGKISVVLGTVLISAYLFITFFPDQAEKLFDLAGISL